MERIDAPAFITAGQRPVPQRLAEVAEHLCGRKQGHPVPKDAEGIAFAPAEVALFRYVPDSFLLCVRIDGAWYELTRVHPGDPDVKALRESGKLTVYGKPKETRCDRLERWPEPTLDEEIAMRRSWRQRAYKTPPDELADRTNEPTGPLAPRLNIV